MEALLSYIPTIIDSLQTINPYKIILYGSLVNGIPNDESDIDLAIILMDERIPADYDEKIENRVKVRDCILDVSFQVPIDLLVYTKGEYEVLKKDSRSFLSQIESEGRVLYAS